MNYTAISGRSDLHLSYLLEIQILKEPKYQADIYNKWDSGESDWICKSCHNSVLKNKMAIQVQLNNMELCLKFSELGSIFPTMFVVAKTKCAQHEIKWECVLVLTDLKKFRTILSRPCDVQYLISLALKCWLTGKIVVNKQQIHPALVNTALQKLTKINPFYSNITTDN